MNGNACVMTALAMTLSLSPLGALSVPAATRQREAPAPDDEPTLRSVDCIRHALATGRLVTVEQMDTILDLISREPLEYMAVFEPEGRLIGLHGGQSARRVRISKAEAVRLRGMTVVHNHPGGRPGPSKIDWRMMLQFGVKTSIIASRTRRGGLETTRVTLVQAIRHAR